MDRTRPGSDTNRPRRCGPGARAKNVLVRDRDTKAEWGFAIEDARFSFSVLDLIRRRFHVTSLRGSGLTFHARNRLTREEAADRRRVALLPPIPGFPDAPLLVPGEGLAGRARVKLGKSLAEVRALTARVGDFQIDGEYQARGASRNGTFLISTGALSLGIGLNGATAEYRFLGAKRWFRERSGREPTRD